MDVLRIRNRAALQLPELDELIDKAYARNAIDNPTQVKSFFQRHMGHEDFYLLVARQNDIYRGLVVMSVDEEQGIAKVEHFYAQKVAGAREALVRALVEFARGRGCYRLLTVDANKKPRAFRRLFQSAGQSREVGRVYEFDLNTAKYGGE